MRLASIFRSSCTATSAAATEAGTRTWASRISFARAINPAARSEASRDRPRHTRTCVIHGFASIAA